MAMKILAFVVLALLSIAGQTELVKFSVSSFIMPDKNLSMQLDVVVPSEKGNYPTIVFITGVAGMTPAVFQQQLIDSVASKDYAWITVRLCFIKVTKLQSPKPTKVTSAFSLVMDWITQNIQAAVNGHGSHATLDLDDRLVLIGHS